MIQVNITVNQCLYLIIFTGFLHFFIMLMFQPSSLSQNEQHLFTSNDYTPTSNLRATTDINDNINTQYHGIPIRYHKLSNPSTSIRVAVLIPYFGDTLPSWFSTFATSAYNSADLYDWFIFITDAPKIDVPSNVKLIRITNEDFYGRLARLDTEYTRIHPDGTPLEVLFKMLMKRFPYVMVEFKSAFGYIFSEYITNYSHWAYADLDILVGQIQNQVSEYHLKNFDIITLSFGDNNRMYLRGQFTISKNRHDVNQLWRGCEHLSKVGNRLNGVFNEHKQFRFNSAEACFSKVAVDQSSFSVLFLTTQYSDAFRGYTDEKETFFIGNTLLKCFKRPLNLTNISAYRQIVNFNQRKTLNIPNSLQLLLDGNGTALKRTTTNCSYWIDPKQAICVDFVPASAAILSQNKKISYIPDEGFNLGNECRVGSFAHFQGWKKQYFNSITAIPPLDAHLLLVSEYGFIPLKLSKISSLNIESIGLYRDQDLVDFQFNNTWGEDVLNAGKLNYKDMLVQGDNGFNRVSRLSSSKDDEFNLSTKYCVKFSSDLKKCICPIMGNQIEFRYFSSLKTTSAGSTSKFRALRALLLDKKTFFEKEKVSLIVTSWWGFFIQGELDAFLTKWKAGPKILVLVKLDNDSEDEDYFSTSDLLHDLTVIRVNLPNCTAGFIDKRQEKKYIFPDKTLVNIGLDVASTKIVSVWPVGVKINVLYKNNDHYNNDIGKNNVKENEIESDDILQYFKNFEINHHKSTKPSVFLTPLYADCSVYKYFESFPLDQSGQNGKMQPSSLKLNFKEFGRLKGVKNIRFNETWWTLPDTVPLPFLFDHSASLHGSKFVRFPEELNGFNCFGASFLSVLVGSGYQLKWGIPQQEQNNTLINKKTNDFKKIFALWNDKFNDESYCQKVKDENVIRLFITKIYSYYRRAEKLRETGLSGLFSRSRFGLTFENDQHKNNN